MPEYVTNAIQLVEAGSNVRFISTPVACNKGYVLHREGSGVFTLKGVVNNSCAQYAQYKVTFGGNIAIPTDGDVAPIAIAIHINGEELESTTAIVTPAAADEYFNVNSFAYISVPRGCCVTIAVSNESTGAINVQDANLIIERTA